MRCPLTTLSAAVVAISASGSGYLLSGLAAQHLFSPCSTDPADSISRPLATTTPSDAPLTTNRACLQPSPPPPTTHRRHSSIQKSASRDRTRMKLELLTVFLRKHAHESGRLSPLDSIVVSRLLRECRLCVFTLPLQNSLILKHYTVFTIFTERIAQTTF